MKTILVPTDFSAVACNALEYALAVATVTQSRILLVHVVDVASTFSQYHTFLDSVTSQLLADAEHELKTIAEKKRISVPVKLQTVCTLGNFVAEVNSLATQNAVDFVVMGTHGQGGILDKIFGTNALAFMNQAKCPVLLVPQNATFKGIHQIAFAYDLDSEVTSVLRQLFQWATPFNAQVSIINCLSERQLNLVPDFSLLQSIIKTFPVENYSLIQRKEDDVVKGIFDFVQENQTEVLAIATHEKVFLEELLHRSVSKRLLFQTQVPLLAFQETISYPKKIQLHEQLTQESYS
ncbi:universal stress protein [Rufibacter hautae]|uniref:Universal stress protein n=1 Tax=Rufibacter hautae TaxID=2595005 RepID=A0A5B6TDN5_9BACT|nr:universal stress protein [Rufibacter hautae]KAA3437134.1 universal stress protein [Rufibacter hautae]